MAVDDNPETMTTVSSETFDRVWRACEEFGVAERHFNELESRYRTFASTWLLATFAGVGFVLSEQVLTLHIDRLLLVAGIGLAGAVGIALLWNLDLMVYHQLLAANFHAGIALERANPWLPQVRTNMLESQGGRGVLPRVVWFYIGGVLAPLTIAVAALVAWGFKHGPLVALAMAVVTVSAAVTLVAYIYTSTIFHTEEIEPELRDSEFDSKVDKAELESTP
jgi:hypothetical protein